MHATMQVEWMGVTEPCFFRPTDLDEGVSAKEAMVKQLEQLSARPVSDKIQQLPGTWTIISLMIGLSSELVITRIPTSGVAPISFCLPNVSWRACIREMDAVIQKSRQILSGHTAEEAVTWSTERKKEWWNIRQLLDEHIEKIIRSMQETLGFWRCLLMKGSSTQETQCVRQCWDFLVSRKAGPVKLAERNQRLLGAIADAQQWLSDTEVVDGMKHIAAEIEVSLCDSEAREILQLLRKLGQHPESTHSSNSSNLTELRTDKIEKMKVGEVKQLLAAEGLSTEGIKKVLIKRLIAARDAALLKTINSRPPQDRGLIDHGSSIILVLSHQLQQFPWEGMDIMTSSGGVTRMPSLDLILQHTISPALTLPIIRRDRIRYLLNPAGDLKSTQNQLRPILEGGVATYGWDGVIGEAPDPDKLRNYLSAADLYIYCGHGSGEAYLHRDQVLSLKSGCSAALLFGCSSGRLEREGIFGPSGAVLAYLQTGSPAVLAMLWDVTDRDIDQLSVKVLREWLLDEEGDSSPSLARVLQDSRNVCKLKYLNGHAAVCYGLPLHVVKS
ncbi:Regulator of spindle pole body duplication [Phytophthora cinnamomi]|uniref:Regulator of spindle pole body duplication n=1 Tax=Phytophthora cinnamomi TaxID=4785 RepID=UPI003559F22D|nr:Regulator of spindle pole body duplication [Phytophthora cinnamomi]